MRPESGGKPRHSNIAVFIPHKGCPHQCSFCNQRTISGVTAAPSAEEVRATLLQARREIRDKASAEIAFFGGSFTAIDREYMLELLEAADEFTGDGGFAGVRISTRPDAVDEEILALLKAHRVTAIELGAQSMDDAVLAKNERGHTAEDVRTASRRIRDSGFSLGLQMMLGLDGDTAEGAYQTAEEFARLRPDTVRIYPTVVLRGTRLAERYFGNAYEPMELREAVEVGAQLLLYFRERDIRVIRMGLHASEDIGEQRIAGPYHPAYRELCESRIYLNRAWESLRAFEKKDMVLEDVTLAVNDRAISKMVGQRRCNLAMLEQHGYWRATVVGDPLIPLYEVEARR